LRGHTGDKIGQFIGVGQGDATATGRGWGGFLMVDAGGQIEAELSDRAGCKGFFAGPHDIGQGGVAGQIESEIGGDDTGQIKGLVLATKSHLAGDGGNAFGNFNKRSAGGQRPVEQTGEKLGGDLAIIVHGLLAHENQIRAFLVNYSGKKPGHGQRLQCIFGDKMNGAMGTHGHGGQQHIARFFRANGDSNNFGVGVGFGQLDRGLDAMAVKGVHGHLHIFGIHTAAIGFKAQTHIRVDDPLDGDQNFHCSTRRFRRSTQETTQEKFTATLFANALTKDKLIHRRIWPLWPIMEEINMFGIRNRGARLAIALAAALMALPGAAVAQTLTAKTDPDALPDQTVASGTRGIVSAWFADKTTVYQHFAFATSYQAKTIRLILDDGTLITHTLPAGDVFEDRAPRLVDMDGDGRDELALITSNGREGGALTIFKVVDGGLRRAGRTKPMGQPQRWLNPAGIADFDGDGQMEVAVVRKPHLRKRLVIWRYDAKTEVFERADAMENLSNHRLGSPYQLMSVTADVDGDGLEDLILPSGDWTEIKIISFAGGKLGELASFDLNGRADGDLVLTKVEGGFDLEVRLDSGLVETVEIRISS
jgi:VCBS repeat protein